MISTEHQAKFNRYYNVAICGGCDVEQAKSIAAERTLSDIMAADAAIFNRREAISGNAVRLEPAPRYRHSPAGLNTQEQPQ